MPSLNWKALQAEMTTARGSGRSKKARISSKSYGDTKEIAGSCNKQRPEELKGIHPRQEGKQLKKNGCRLLSKRQKAAVEEAKNTSAKRPERQGKQGLIIAAFAADLQGLEDMIPEKP